MVTLEESRYFAVNYFCFVADAQAAGKAIKEGSSKTKAPKIDKVDYAKQPVYHPKEVELLMNVYVERIIPLIRRELVAGFNVALYGFGSKKGLLDRIASEHAGSLFIDGYSPDLTVAVVHTRFQSAGVNLKMPGEVEKPLLALIYGFDSISLRNETFYRLLADACASGRIQLVLAFEDPSFFLMFSPSILSRLHLVYHDCTTFLPYIHCELDTVPDLLSSKTNNRRSIKGALFVLQSLTSNARSIFRLLAEHQLSARPDSLQEEAESEPDSDGDSDAEENTDTTGDGMPQAELFRLSQSRFLCSNETAFRLILTEFLDHELIKTVRSSLNGADVLRIPFSSVNLRDMLSLMATM